jgi:hypothetical protein
MRISLSTWIQTIGTTLIAVKRCSLVHIWMPAQGSRSAHGLLYLAAIRDWREHQDRLTSAFPARFPSLRVCVRLRSGWPATWAESAAVLRERLCACPNETGGRTRCRAARGRECWLGPQSRSGLIPGSRAGVLPSSEAPVRQTGAHAVQPGRPSRACHGRCAQLAESSGQVPPR